MVKGWNLDCHKMLMNELLPSLAFIKGNKKDKIFVKGKRND